MTGIERLRKLSEDAVYISLWNTLLAGREDDWDCEGCDDKTLKDTLAAIADQIERERNVDSEGLYEENEDLRDMLNQVAWHLGLGDEVHYYSGDNYAACQSRVLDAIDGLTERESDVETVRSDAMEAWEWVRDHGGLDHVKSEWSSRVPHDLYERRRQRLLGHIAECEAALGRRNVRIEELGKTIEFFQLNNSNFRHLLADVAERLGFTRYGDDYEPEDLIDALDRRLMPEGVEWPRFEDGEPVRVGGAIADELGRAHEVTSVEVFDDGADVHWSLSEPEECVWAGRGKTVRRPAVPAGDDEPLEAGQTVWHEDGTELKVLGFGDEEDGETIVRVEYVSGPTRWGEVRSLSLAHAKPEPKRTCGYCRHWQGDPSASHMGVCFNSYQERCCVDSYAAQLDYAKACDDFEERGE